MAVQVDGVFVNLLLTVCAGLIAAGVGGLWKLSNSVAALQVTVSSWSKIFEDRFVFITAKVDDHEKRVGVLEGKASLPIARSLSGR